MRKSTRGTKPSARFLESVVTQEEDGLELQDAVLVPSEPKRKRSKRSGGGDAGSKEASTKSESSKSKPADVEVEEDEDELEEVGQSRQQRVMEDPLARRCRLMEIQRGQFRRFMDRVIKADRYGLLIGTELGGVELLGDDMPCFGEISKKLDQGDYYFVSVDEEDWVSSRAALKLLGRKSYDGKKELKKSDFLAIDYDKFEKEALAVPEYVLKALGATEEDTTDPRSYVGTAKKMTDFIRENVAHLRNRHKEELEKILTEESLDRLALENREPAMSGWRKKPFEPRQYNVIQYYQPVEGLTEEEAKKIMSRLVADQEGNHWIPTPGVDFGFDDQNCTFEEERFWVTKKVGKDVIETDTWGIDPFARRNILIALESIKDTKLRMTQPQIQWFIEGMLMREINALPSDIAYDISHSLTAIRAKAQALLNANSDDHTVVKQEPNQASSSSVVAEPAPRVIDSTPSDQDSQQRKRSRRDTSAKTITTVQQEENQDQDVEMDDNPSEEEEEEEEETTRASRKKKKSKSLTRSTSASSARGSRKRSRKGRTRRHSTNSLPDGDGAEEENEQDIEIDEKSKSKQKSSKSRSSSKKKSSSRSKKRKSSKSERSSKTSKRQKIEPREEKEDDGLVGTRISVFLPTACAWFWGRIVEFCGAPEDEGKHHRVQFDDGSTEWIDISNQRCILENRRETIYDKNIPPQLIIAGVDALLDAREKWGQHNFCIHPKGTGVVCATKLIQKGDLVGSYFGELYPLWLWERKESREDAQRKAAARGGSGKVTLPDFWNMRFEIPPESKGGSFMMYADAKYNGSFTSRLSHSCRPNCTTMLAVIDGHYSIAVRAMRDIEEGEELCIDYNCVTDSIDEFRAAICLCGSEGCRGSFLYITGAQQYMQVVNRRHRNVHRIAMLLEASMSDNTLFDFSNVVAEPQATNAEEAAQRDAQQKNGDSEETLDNDDDLQTNTGTGENDIDGNNSSGAKNNEQELSENDDKKQDQENENDKGMDFSEEPNVQRKKLRSKRGGSKTKSKSSKSKAAAVEDKEEMEEEEEEDEAEVEADSNLLGVDIRGLDRASRKRLAEFGLKGNVLESLPLWLLKYCALALRFVELEQLELPARLFHEELARRQANIEQAGGSTSVELQTKSKSGKFEISDSLDEGLVKDLWENVQRESKGIASQRVSHMLIALSKVRHRMDTRIRLGREGSADALAESIMSIDSTKLSQFGAHSPRDAQSGTHEMRIKALIAESEIKLMERVWWIGDRCEAKWCGDDAENYPGWYPGTILHVHHDGLKGLSESDLKLGRARLLDQPSVHFMFDDGFVVDRIPMSEEVLRRPCVPLTEIEDDSAQEKEEKSAEPKEPESIKNGEEKNPEKQQEKPAGFPAPFTGMATEHHQSPFRPLSDEEIANALWKDPINSLVQRLLRILEAKCCYEIKVWQCADNPQLKAPYWWHVETREVSKTRPNPDLATRTMYYVPPALAKIRKLVETRKVNTAAEARKALELVRDQMIKIPAFKCRDDMMVERDEQLEESHQKAIDLLTFYCHTRNYFVVLESPPVKTKIQPWRTTLLERQAELSQVHRVKAHQPTSTATNIKDNAVSEVKIEANEATDKATPSISMQEETSPAESSNPAEQESSQAQVQIKVEKEEEKSCAEMGENAGAVTKEEGNTEESKRSKGGHDLRKVTINIAEAKKNDYFLGISQEDGHHHESSISAALLGWLDQKEDDLDITKMIGSAVLPEIESAYTKVKRPRKADLVSVWPYLQHGRQKLQKQMSHRSKRYEEWDPEVRECFPDTPPSMVDGAVDAWPPPLPPTKLYGTPVVDAAMADNQDYTRLSLGLGGSFQDVYANEILEELEKPASNKGNAVFNVLIHALKVVRRPPPVASMASTSSKDVGLVPPPPPMVEQATWVLCERCEKWRKLPPGCTGAEFKDPFYCEHLHEVDLEHASCSIPEESIPKGESTLKWGYGINDVDDLKVGDRVDAFCRLKKKWFACEIVEAQPDAVRVEFPKRAELPESAKTEWIPRHPETGELPMLNPLYSFTNKTEDDNNRVYTYVETTRKEMSKFGPKASAKDYAGLFAGQDVTRNIQASILSIVCELVNRVSDLGGQPLGRLNVKVRRKVLLKSQSGGGRPVPIGRPPSAAAATTAAAAAAASTSSSSSSSATTDPLNSMVEGERVLKKRAAPVLSEKELAKERDKHRQYQRECAFQFFKEMKRFHGDLYPFKHIGGQVDEFSDPQLEMWNPTVWGNTAYGFWLDDVCDEDMGMCAEGYEAVEADEAHVLEGMVVQTPYGNGVVIERTGIRTYVVAVRPQKGMEVETSFGKGVVESVDQETGNTAVKLSFGMCYLCDFAVVMEMFLAVPVDPFLTARAKKKEAEKEAKLKATSLEDLEIPGGGSPHPIKMEGIERQISNASAFSAVTSDSTSRQDQQEDDQPTQGQDEEQEDQEDQEEQEEQEEDEQDLEAQDGEQE